MFKSKLFLIIGGAFYLSCGAQHKMNTANIASAQMPVETSTTISGKEKENLEMVTATDPVNEVMEATAIDTTVTQLPKVKEDEEPIPPKKASKAPDHALWNTLLGKHVADDGNVNYKGFANDNDKLQTYLMYLAENAPTDSWSKNELLAYYINLYNAATVKLIIDNYPLKSIKDIKGPWDKKVVVVGDKKLSLGEIEHKILRKMDEPRIHFAINCASYSCPKLLNVAFSAAEMEKLLQQTASEFVNDSKRNILSVNTIQISQIFKWFKKDFTSNGSLIDFVNKYGKTEVAAGAKVTHLKYDWSLNEAK
ncbi:DUF547 domain-containing protein [Spongiimicrobium sp. 3-5]|uniref:DUF547 domain-containing protein n=1 Tax=Spongiimicrobium sp. 3-5 TaxID=3332596 RepID=UPI00397E96FD